MSRKHKARKLVVYTLFVCISLFCLTGSASAFVLGPTHYPEYNSPGKWGDFGDGTSGGVVTWSIMPTGVTKNGVSAFTSLADFMPTGFKSVIESAFSAWSAVADIQFVEVADAGEAFGAVTADSAHIRIGGHDFDGAGGTLAHAYFPPGWSGIGMAGDIHFDTAETWKLVDGGPGFNLSRVLTHEIGHAIGLGHEDSIASLMNSYYTESTPLGLTADDIAGVRYLYGEAIGDPYTSISDLPYDEMVVIAAVPEPGTIALLGIGLVGLAGVEVRRRQKKKAVNKSK